MINYNEYYEDTMIHYHNKHCEDCMYAIRTASAESGNFAILNISYLCKIGHPSSQCKNFKEKEELIKERIESKDW